MNDDHKLTQLAAKAAGIEAVMRHTHVGVKRMLPALAYDGMSHTEFDPLNHDGDALRLAVKLNLDLSFRKGIGGGSSGAVGDNGRTGLQVETHGDDAYAATRRAIVRAAAEIGMRA